MSDNCSFDMSEIPFGKIDFSKEEVSKIFNLYIELLHKANYNQDAAKDLDKIANLICLSLDDYEKTCQSFFLQELDAIISDYVITIKRAEIKNILDYGDNTLTSNQKRAFSHIAISILGQLENRRKDLLDSIMEERVPKNSVETLRRINEIEDEVNRKVAARLQDVPRQLGYCHCFWGEKKKILREEYGIEWYTPAEEDPSTCYD